MNYRRSQLNVPHPLSAHATVSHFDPTPIADHALVLHATIFAASTFPVLFWAKNSLAEQTIAFRSISPIVNRLWLLDFTERPTTNVVRTRQSNTHSPEIVNSLVPGRRFASTHTRPHTKSSLVFEPSTSRCVGQIGPQNTDDIRPRSSQA